MLSDLRVELIKEKKLIEMNFCRLERRKNLIRDQWAVAYKARSG